MSRHGNLISVVVEIFQEGTANPGKIQDDIMTAVENGGYEVIASEVTLNRPKTLPDRKANTNAADA